MEAVYFEIKEKLTAKYGEPKSVEETGPVPEYDAFIGSNIEYSGLTRRTVFGAELGYVIVGIDLLDIHETDPKAHTYVSYIDKDNEAKGEQEADDDL